MSRRYDSRTTIFSPQGRLFQVEYAMQAINHAGTCVGISYENGVVLGAEKRNINKLLDNFLMEKIYKISDNIICSVAGVTADASVLINEMRLSCERHFYKFQEEITVEQLVVDICNLKQQYTQVGGYRPFGVSMLYAGWDRREGFQLYQSDPSGNYSAWKATCIGKNNTEGVSLLKQIYKPNLTLQQSLEVAVKTLSKSIEKNLLDSENIELVYICSENEKVIFNILTAAELNAVIKIVKEEAPKEDS